MPFDPKSVVRGKETQSAATTILKAFRKMKKDDPSSAVRLSEFKKSQKNNRRKGDPKSVVRKGEFKK